MFITSKRCFLNVVCPLTPKEVLLNANYYIADCRSPDTIIDTLNSYHYENGQLVEDKQSDIKSATIYNIKYGNGCLNMAPYLADILNDVDRMRISTEERVLNYLSSYNTMKSIAEEIYMPKRRGNGLLFIIFYHDDSIVNFGDTIARFLAYNFGEDITFIDPKFRHYVRGTETYAGNKERAELVARDLKEAMLIMGFLTASSNSIGVEESMNNMTAFLGPMDFNSLIHLYESLFPEEPLPPGNYSCENIREIIMAKMIDTHAASMQLRKQNALNIIDTYDKYY